jgi:hypothetical protein
MVDLGQESDLRRGHWVIIRKEKLELEDTTYHNISDHWGFDTAGREF